MDSSELRRERNIASAARWRLIFAILAVVAPLGLFALFHRQESRLRSLVDHGRTATATVTGVTHQGGEAYTEYSYEVGGQKYDWSVGRRDAPYAIGQKFAVAFLPEDPSLSRPGAAYSRRQFEAEVDLTFQHGLLAGLFGFFALMVLWCTVLLRRLRAGVAPRTEPWLTPVAAGRLVAGLLWAVTLGVNLDPKVVVTVQRAAFGGAPFGLPIVPVVCLVETVLFAPFFWVFPHLMGIVADARARGASVSKSGVIVAVLRAGDPKLRRSRAIVLAGLAYFLALMAAWIAFAGYRGV